ncbi:Queuine tRNA-ribosyltransferase-like protein [Ceratocystis platani]|uniref:Queuine tRNA-ribosyltransferase accessory subunit 2 n=1 Tax=Ceratocystis fimbriata f. sp. platani TaxID=88771 RepID=A0A0F8BN39_CERFI|nr:Queuine tRNA-ribosyltransferase-like protein [Ceratocystis platani]
MAESVTELYNRAAETEEFGAMFRVVKPALGTAGASQAARLGRLSLPGRPAMETPTFFAVASRGTVPHVTQDNLIKHTQVQGAFMALEDFIERKQPPIFNIPATPHGALRTFTATPDQIVTVLAARRVPQVPAPLGNSEKHVTVFTSTGFAQEKATDYPAHVAMLQPDIAVPLADLSQTGHGVISSTKRMRRMGFRTEAWIDTFLEALPREMSRAKGISVYAPVIPTPLPMQWEYLQHLVELAPQLDGLALYDAQLLKELEDEAYKPLASLPRLALDSPKTPHDVLRNVSLGIDVITAPFLNNISDAGVCLTFKLPSADAPLPTGSDSEDALQNQRQLLPSAEDMWRPANQADINPFVKGCRCYTCTKHHRAYVHHLLQAKEMLGWTLLQIHNYHVLSSFMADIRSALANGTFEEQKARFLALYDEELPQGTGARPRARGYHFKGEAHQPKANPSAWESFNPEKSRLRSQSPPQSDVPLDTHAAKMDAEGKTRGSDTPVEDNVAKKLKTEID